MNRYFIIGFVLVIVSFVIYRMKNASNDSLAKVKEKISSGALVVDVRTKAEFNSGHFPGAVNIPINEVQNQLGKFGDKNRPIVLYCASGGRSGMALSQLQSEGFTDVTNAGGLSDMPK
ncbi:rhodanese-like domain-containing protein [Leptospira sp. 96542]|nr:rhodanese-like domain-containing protein [Leptospira sp. 96542]